jgi:hypothetical protein
MGIIDTPDTKIKADIAWAQHHLFLLAAVAVLTFAGIYGVLSLIARHDHDAALQQEAILKTFTQQNQLVQAQTKAQIDTLTQQNVALEQQVSSIATAIVARDRQLAQQQQTIKALPPPQLAAKWGEVASEPAPSIDTQGNFLAPIALVQKSVDALLSLPVLQADINDLKIQLTEETTIAYNNDVKYQDEKKAHTSDNELGKQTVATKDAEIKDLKAAARKRNVIIAIIGGALGFGLGHKF